MEAKRENGGNACDVCSSSSPNKLKTITRGSDKNPQLGRAADFVIDQAEETDDIVLRNVSEI